MFVMPVISGFPAIQMAFATVLWPCRERPVCCLRSVLPTGIPLQLDRVGW